MVNLGSKRSGPIEVDPRAWQRFGYVGAAEADAVAEAA
jgi:hypothetical protein